MKPGGGKAKGNGYEGQIAKKLNKALSPLTFMRSPGSGARLGGKNFATFSHLFGEDATKLFVGDVVPTNEKDVRLRFKFNIECKSYKTPDNFTALVSGNANFFKWFEESVVDAEKIDKLPMLICKWNHTPSFVGVASDPSSIVKPRFTIIRDGRSIDVFDLDDLLVVPNFWYDPY
jgi:hypothetical protein